MFIRDQNQANGTANRTLAKIAIITPVDFEQIAVSRSELIITLVLRYDLRAAMAHRSRNFEAAVRSLRGCQPVWRPLACSPVDFNEY